MRCLEDLANEIWAKKKIAYDQLAIDDMKRATASQAEALYQYTLSHDINLFLKRCAKEKIDIQKVIEHDRQNLIVNYIRDIDLFLGGGEKLLREVILYKGVIRKDLERLFTAEKLRSKNFVEVKGKKFFECAYMSTTIDKNYAFEAIAKNKKFYHEEKSEELDALFCVHVPAGYRVSAVDKMSLLFGSQETIQHEILLPRAQSFIVQDVCKSEHNGMCYLCFNIVI